MTLLQKLQWRYAAKKMDPAQAVPQEKVDRILEAIRLTATSSGLQPYELIVVTNPAIRQKIKDVYTLSLHDALPIRKSVV